MNHYANAEKQKSVLFLCLDFFWSAAAPKLLMKKPPLLSTMQFLFFDCTTAFRMISVVAIFIIYTSATLRSRERNNSHCL